MSEAAANGSVEGLVAANAAGHRQTLRRAIFAGVAAALSGTALLGLSGWFLTGAGIAGATGGAAVYAFNYLVPSAVIRLLAVLRTGGRYFERLLAHQAALLTLAGVRVGLIAQLAGADPRASRALSGADAATRLTADVDALEDRIIRAPARPGAVAASLLALLLLAAASPLALVPVLLILLALPRLVAFLARRLVDEPADRAQALLGQLKAAMGDMLAAGPEIAVYGLAGEAAGQLQLTADEMDAAKRQAARGMAVATAALTIAGPLTAALALFLGTGPAPLVAGAALALLAAAESLGAPVRARLEESRTARGLRQLEDLAAPGPFSAVGRLAGNAAAALEIDGVKLSPGQTLALTGQSGSGKTRILETLAGLRTDAPQTLQVGGTDPRAILFADLAMQFAIARQDPVLLAGTIADNLRLARPGLSDESLWQALETACLADEVSALPEGLLSWLGESGTRLSGGQRKRLALARALLAGRPWVLLDEPSEGLDAATEALLAKRLGNWLKANRVGAIVATHRPALASMCKRRHELFSAHNGLSA